MNRTFNATKSRFLLMLSGMESKAHWPDRTKEFDYRKSEVCKWILEQELTWDWIFQKARDSGAIVFNPDTKEWVGAETEVGKALKSQRGGQVGNLSRS